mmetsp:Transcript_31451/g.42585  ORF Transcript_31451/g.42585 Transcript_31451/m.42585 type:complete len:83 (-) Transcript_31451:220-468(-)
MMKSARREAQDEKRPATEASIAKAAAEISAANRAVEQSRCHRRSPQKEAPTLVVPRSLTKSKNQFGYCLTSRDHLSSRNINY